MAKVFISYAKKDYIGPDGKPLPGNFVEPLVSVLSEAGISYWIDRERLEPGDTYAARISRNIKECECFVFLSSKAANASEWTLREISTAIQFGKRIIPVRLDASPYDEAVSLYLASIQYVDLKELGLRETLRQVVSQVLHPEANPVGQMAYGSLPVLTTVTLYAALVVLTGIYALLTYLFLWSKTIQTSEVIGGLVGFVGEFALLLSVYYVLRILRKRHCTFILPASLVAVVLLGGFLANRIDLFICAGLLLLGWFGIILACLYRTPSRPSFFSQMSRQPVFLKVNDPENLLLVYLVVKCFIVVVGHWFEAFMNLADYLEMFRY